MTEEIQNQRAIDMAKNFDEIFSSKTGKIVLCDLVERAGFLSNNFDEDPYKNAFLSGQRDFIAYIFAKLSYDISALNELIEAGKSYEDKYSALDQ